jgi:hypothetical protein
MVMGHMNPKMLPITNKMMYFERLFSAEKHNLYLKPDTLKLCEYF